MRRLAVVATLLAARVAVAQPADVPAQIKLIETQPADMDKSAWKEKRRDAARRLAQSKDKRAVPVLIKLVETENFDIIGEIAIEGLGNLGDPSAVPVLQKAANDNTRDKSTRDLAKKALAKLGASADTKPSGGTTAPPDSGKPGGGTTATGGATTTATTTTTTTTGGTTEPPPPDAGTGTGEVTTSTTSDAGAALLGAGKSSADMPALPDLPADTLAAYDRMTFAGGAASLGYDTVRKRTVFDADVAGSWVKRVEREKMAWGLDVDAHVVAGLVNPKGRAVTRGLEANVSAGGEARFYSGKVYGIGKAAGGFQELYIADVDDTDPNQDIKDTRFTADLQVAIGGGYGRVLDVGGAIRVRRLARTLDAARALGKPIDAATARRLQLTWWALRGERSSYRALTTTVAILREAGILLGEPDAGLSYEILTVLRDSQLFLRPSGLDIQLAIGEGYLQRPDGMGAPAQNEHGRVEQLLASAGYGQQLQDDKLEISGTAYARYRLFAPDDQPSPWGVGATARMRRFTYGDHGDPFGALDLSGDVRASDDSHLMGGTSQVALRVQGQIGFTWWLNQASGFRLAGTVAEDGGEMFIGAELSATYGLLDGTFAGL
jgi:hypothetical protein